MIKTIKMFIFANKPIPPPIGVLFIIIIFMLIKNNGKD